MNKNNAAWVAVTILAAGLIVIASFLFYTMMYMRDLPMPVEPDGGIGDGAGPITACTLEARQCPDGTYVGRQGPNCEFAPCPSGIKVEVR